MQAIIESFSDFDPNKNGRGPSAKIKFNNGDWCYINQDPASLVGKTVDIDIRQPEGKKYKVGKIVKVYEATATASAQSANGNGNGSFRQITWDAYRAMAEAAHELACKFEPDTINGMEEDNSTTVCDRSTARAAILNTVMIAYSNGKIFVPTDDDDIPPF